MKLLRIIKYKLSKHYVKLQLLIISSILRTFNFKVSVTENGTFCNLLIYHKESKNGFWILVDYIDKFTLVNNYVEVQ